MKVIEIMKDIDDKVTFEKGYQLILNDRVQEGLEKLLSLEEFHSDWWKLLFFIALAYRKLERYDKAIEYYRKTLEYNSSHVETMNELGICYLSNKQYDLAEETYKEALKHDQNNHELLCNLGIVYLNTGKLEMAREQLYKAKEIKPDDEIVNAWINQLNQM
jgi:tetratricopeptide (TPR) repeat protein